MRGKSEEWEISTHSHWFDFRRQDFITYRDLLFRLVRKNFLSSYQQTLLGPFWVLFQPVFTVLTYVLVFNQVLGVSTEGVPSFAYYLAGVILWNLFSEILLNTSGTISTNAEVFSKVYFPRLIAPLSVLLISLIHFGIQWILFFLVLCFLYFNGNIHFEILHFPLFIPAIILTVFLGFGGGLIFSIITCKYRDLSGFLQMIIRVLMFITPVFFPLAIVPSNIKFIVLLNPLAPVFELYRFAFFGTGQVHSENLLYSVLISIIILIAGMAVFNKFNSQLIDVV